MRDAAIGLGLRLLHIVRWAWPPWWFYAWIINRWVRHDCDKQPILCRQEWVFLLPSWMWLDV